MSTMLQRRITRMKVWGEGAGFGHRCVKICSVWRQLVLVWCYLIDQLYCHYRTVYDSALLLTWPTHLESVHFYGGDNFQWGVHVSNSSYVEKGQAGRSKWSLASTTCRMATVVAGESFSIFEKSGSVKYTGSWPICWSKRLGWHLLESPHIEHFPCSHSRISMGISR
jgi:hypothetical protein